MTLAYDSHGKPITGKHMWRLERKQGSPYTENNTTSYIFVTDSRRTSLTSFILKTTERLVDRYIRDRLLSRKPISENNHVNETRRSMETALSRYSGVSTGNSSGG